MTGYKRHKIAQLRRNDAGVTLIEIIFAAGIVATALGIMLGSLVTLAVMGDVAEGRARAITAKSGVLEQMRAAGPRNFLLQPLEQVVVDDHVLDVSMQMLTADGDFLDAPLDLEDDGPFSDPMELQITVEWEGLRGRRYSIRSSALIGI